jgi:uracil-DNA glycosylase family 4
MNTTPTTRKLPLIRGTIDGADCAACPLAKLGQAARPVVAEGPANPDWILVGEGPGMNEQREGRPFIGASGRMVDRMLQMIRVPRDTLWITNATACLPPPNATDAVKKRAQQCCAPRLQAELAQFDPAKPILALGAVAAQGFLGDKFSITQMAGSLWRADTDGTGQERYVIPTVHPAAILRGGAGGGGAHSVDLLFVNLVYDASKVARLAAGKEVVFSDDIETEIEDPARASALVAEFLCDLYALPEDQRWLAVDVETVADVPGRSALEPLHTKLTAIGLATQVWGLSIYWEILDDGAKDQIAAALADAGLIKVFHNQLYDIPALYHAGFEVQGPIEDTLLMHHSAFPGSPHDLQRVGTQFFAMAPWKAEYRAMKGGDPQLHVSDDEAPAEESAQLSFETINGDDAVQVEPEPEGKKKRKSKKKVEDPVVSEAKLKDELQEHTTYNARDSLVTARLMVPLRNSLRQSKSSMTYDIDTKMAAVAARMHWVGVPISREVNDDLSKRFTEIVKRTRKEIEDRVADPEVWPKFIDYVCAEQAKRIRKLDSADFLVRHQTRLQEAEKDHLSFLIGSGEHVGAYLKARGVNMYMQTAKGKTSTTRDFLETLTTVPEVRDILDYREASKMLSTFVVSIAKFIHDDGRIHPMWSVNKITGRWGAERPQVMNWPKANKKKNRPNLRAQVVAPPGRKFVGADFAQLEARIIAMLSGDDFLVGIFRDHKDIHSEFARLVWPNFDEIEAGERKELRDMIKRPEYGSFYGGDPTTLHAAVVKDYPQVTLAQIRNMVRIMQARMPGVQKWHEMLIRQVATTNEIRSAIYGRRRTFPTGNADPTDTYNFGVQATGADIMDTGLIRLVDRLGDVDPTAEVILQIHDALVVECDEDRAPDVQALVSECLHQEHTHNGVTVEFPADAEIGDDWTQV